MQIPGEKDYYHILGVLRTATPTDISAAYYLLAHRHHPDVSPASVESLAQLKLINEAYDVLSDADKRREYDRRHRLRSAAVTDAGTYPPVGPSRRTPSTARPSVVSEDVELELPIAPEEARHGGPCEFTVTLHETCDRCAGQGRVAGSWCDACWGHGRIRRRRRLQVLLPGGVQNGTVIRVVGQGRRSATAVSDLLLRIKVRPCW